MNEDDEEDEDYDDSFYALVDLVLEVREMIN